MLTPEEAVAKVGRATQGFPVYPPYWKENLHGRRVIVAMICWHAGQAVVSSCALPLDEIVARSDDELTTLLRGVVMRTEARHQAREQETRTT
jgi:hypothetical protein